MNRCGLLVVALALAVGLTNDFATADSDEYATHHELGLMQGFPPPPDKRVDRSNAAGGVPFNRWSYQNMRTIFPSANIPPAESPVAVKTRIDGGIERLKVKRADGSEVNLVTFLEETYTDAFVVIKDDAIVFERYMNGMHANQPHQMWSVTKSFAGLFSAMAVHDGLADDTAPISKYVPELAASSAFGTASLRQVQDMTNSLDFSEDYTDKTSGIHQYGRVLGLTDTPVDELPADSIHSYLVTLQQSSSGPGHGRIFHYQTPKTDVVNWVTNRVTGKSFQEDLARLWADIGAAGETYVLLDRNGTLFAGGGLNATPHNLARFAMMMLNDGVANGKQVIPTAVIAELEDGADKKAFSDGPEPKGEMADGNWSYRAQWWVRHKPNREAINALGIHGQWITIDRARGIAFVKQSSQPVASSPQYDDYVFNAMDAISDYLTQ